MNFSSLLFPMKINSEKFTLITLSFILDCVLQIYLDCALQKAPLIKVGT